MVTNYPKYLMVFDSGCIMHYYRKNEVKEGFHHALLDEAKVLGIDDPEYKGPEFLWTIILEKRGGVAPIKIFDRRLRNVTEKFL